jgi:RimJ/RimL family protein N-acetyltransferase
MHVRQFVIVYKTRKALRVALLRDGRIGAANVPHAPPTPEDTPEELFAREDTHIAGQPRRFPQDFPGDAVAAFAAQRKLFGALFAQLDADGALELTPEGASGYALLAPDIMFRRDGSPVLIEINRHGGMAPSTPEADEVYRNVFRALREFVLAREFPAAYPPDAAELRHCVQVYPASPPAMRLADPAPRHAAELLKILGDAETMKFVGNGKPWDAAKLARFLGYAKKETGRDPLSRDNFYWVAEVDNRAIGFVGVHKAQHGDAANRARFFRTTVLSREYHGRGMGAELDRAGLAAFAALRPDVEKVFSDIREGHPASIAAALRAGFLPSDPAQGDLPHRQKINGMPVAYRHFVRWMRGRHA